MQFKPVCIWHGHREQLLIFFSPPNTLETIFFRFCRLNLICSLLCVVLGSLLWALIFATNLILQVDVTLPAKSHSAEQTGNMTLPVLQAILHLIYLMWWLLFFLTVWYCWLMFSLWSSITSHIVFWWTATYPVIFYTCSRLILLNCVTLLLFCWITCYCFLSSALSNCLGLFWILVSPSNSVAVASCSCMACRCNEHMLHSFICSVNKGLNKPSSEQAVAEPMW